MRTLLISIFSLLVIPFVQAQHIKVKPLNEETIQAGGIFRAEIWLDTLNNCPMDLLVDGRPVSTKNGKGIFENLTKESGEYKHRAMFSVKNKLGEIEVFQYAFTYSVPYKPLQPSVNTQTEIIHNDSVRINNILPMYTTLDDIIKLLGNPDSTQFNDYSCYAPLNVNGMAYFYGNSTFDVDTQTNRAILTKLDMQDGKLTFNTGRLVLDSSTTLDEMAQTYPVAFKGSRTSYTQNSERILRILQTPQNPPRTWVFRFVNNKLVEITIFIPC